METREINFDGIVGPTHNYAGLSYGNIASMENQKKVSNPRAAALQGLEKMHALSKLGIMQAVLLPHDRPHLPTLRKIGFTGSDAEILLKAMKSSPELLIACTSASAMWTANAATFCPSIDSIDNHMHITAANLINKFHRSIEAETTKNMLKAIFHSANHFIHHDPLIPNDIFSDEGAANHMRLCRRYGEKGVQVFVYGYSKYQNDNLCHKFPPRQTYEASQAIARLHHPDVNSLIFAQQSLQAIDAGVFHNDVIAVANQNVLLYHEDAFKDTSHTISEIGKKVSEICHCPLIAIEIKRQDLTLKDAVDCYLFNSQIITLPDESMILVAPEECRLMPTAKKVIDNIVAASDNPINDVIYFNLHESMRNGGGPACLRIRAVVTPEELAAIHPYIILTEELYQKLKAWITEHYRTELSPKDLADPLLLEESRSALDQLTHILHMGSLYDFQLH